MAADAIQLGGSRPSAPRPVQAAALELDGVVKKYGPHTALHEVSIRVSRHEVVGLIGENGAGKSTLLKILTGVEQPTSGNLLLRGEPTTINGVRGANARGIGMVFQEQSLISPITVGENILLGHEGEGVARGVYHWRRLHATAQGYLDAVGAQVRASQPTHELSFAKRQMVEVAKALASADITGEEPVILLDEPTSVLESQEIEQLFGVIDELRKKASVIFVSHRMEEVLRVCDRVYILRDGQVVGEYVPADVAPEELHSLMVGEDLSEGYYHEDKRQEHRSENQVSLRGLRTTGLDGIDLEVRKGEIVSLLGVKDSGREALGRALFGASPILSGEVYLEGRSMACRHPSGAVSRGVGYVPSDRKTDGAVLNMSVQDNMVLAHPAEVSRFGLLDPVQQRTRVKRWFDRLRIKAPGPMAPMRNLSGGNQQKVVLAKWLLDPDLKLLILDTPTRGLDVGAKSEVYSLIRELAGRGISVLLIADTLEEGIHMAHRVVTMKDGRLSGEFECSPNGKPEPSAVLERMI